MTIKIKKLLHVGVRVSPDEDSIKKASLFYSDLLGLQQDTKRPDIQGIPGFWVNVSPGDRTQQIHVMGAMGASPVSRSDKQDPTRTHMAFSVQDIEVARSELTEQGIHFWEYGGLVGRASFQLFFEDPCGNMIELQQSQEED